MSCILVLISIMATVFPDHVVNEDKQRTLKFVLNWDISEVPPLPPVEMEHRCDQILENSESLEPNIRAEVHLRRAAIRYLQKKKDLAMRDYEAVLTIRPGDVDALLGRVAIWFGSKTTARRGVAEVNAVLLKYPDLAYAWHLKGAAEASLQRHSDAVASFTKAIRLDPLSLKSYLNRAAIYMVQHEFKRALEDLNRAHEINPAYVTERAPFFHMRGVILSRLGHREESFANFLEAHRRHPEKIATIGELWLASASMQRFGYCEHFSRLLLKYDPESANTRRVRAVTLAQTGRPEEALPLIEQVIENESAKRGDYDRRARIHMMLGHDAEAAEDYERVIKDDLRTIGVLIRYAFLLATSPDTDIRNGKRAQSFAEDCIKRLKTSKQRPIAEMVLAMSYAEQGETDEAAKLAAAVVEKADVDAKTKEKWQKLVGLFKSGSPYRHDVTKPETLLFNIPPLLTFYSLEARE